MIAYPGIPCRLDDFCQVHLAADRSSGRIASDDDFLEANWNIGVQMSRTKFDRALLSQISKYGLDKLTHTSSNDRVTLTYCRIPANQNAAVIARRIYPDVGMASKSKRMWTTIEVEQTVGQGQEGRSHGESWTVMLVITGRIEYNI